MLKLLHISTWVLNLIQKKTELGAGGHVGISKYKFIFLKGYKPN